MKAMTMFLAGAAILAPLAAGAQGGMAAPKPAQGTGMQMEHKEMSGWAQLDAFHELLAAAWHPVGQGDYKPARATGAKLLDAALAWRKSRGPAACDTEALRAGFAAMLDDVRSFTDAVKREASDDAIRATLKRAHDGFEAIAEPCMMAAMKKMEKKP